MELFPGTAWVQRTSRKGESKSWNHFQVDYRRTPDDLERGGKGEIKKPPLGKLQVHQTTLDGRKIIYGSINPAMSTY